jgi:hypothetical protein
VAVLPDDIQDRIRQATHTAARVDPLMAAASDVATKTWPRSLVVKVCSGVARPSGEPDDPLLERLVEEALFHRIAERRFTLAQPRRSPYARDRGLAARGRRACMDGEPSTAAWSRRPLALLTFIGTEAERDLPCRVAEATRRCAPRRTSRGAPPARRRRHRRPAVVPLLRGEPGQRGRRPRRPLLRGDDPDPVLHRVRDDAAMPEWVRRGGWWLRRGPPATSPSPRHR